LLETATSEHSNIPVMKHLLRTASFAKTFPEANGYDSNNYVNIVKHMVVLSKLRNSPNVILTLSLSNLVCKSNHL
jgi:hypothetical protein